MNNATKKTSEAGIAAQDLIVHGLEVNAEIALEEPQMTQGVDEALRKLCAKYGVREVLASIHDASWGAAEVHEDTDEVEDMTSFRLRVFGNRLSEAIKALR